VSVCVCMCVCGHDLISRGTSAAELRFCSWKSWFRGQKDVEGGQRGREGERGGERGERQGERGRERETREEADPGQQACGPRGQEFRGAWG